MGCCGMLGSVWVGTGGETSCLWWLGFICIQSFTPQEPPGKEHEGVRPLRFLLVVRVGGVLPDIAPRIQLGVDSTCSGTHLWAYEPGIFGMKSWGKMNFNRPSTVCSGAAHC